MSDSPSAASPLARFHPTIARWFAERLGAPTPPQVEGWPAIADGDHTLIAAPTGSGKTLAAFLHAIDALVTEGSAARERGEELPPETRVLYISPLKALGNDVQKNLAAPLAELRALDPEFPEIQVSVRSGDTPPGERAKMTKRPPHILVTTPESLYILLTSDGGRRMLETVRVVIVDEIHAMLGDKRGAHLALSLERLEHLVVHGAKIDVSEGESTTPPYPASTAPVSTEPASTEPASTTERRAPQRIGLSATQKPVADVANFLVGVGRECTTIDIGHRRIMDLALLVPETPLETICSSETWDEIYNRIVTSIESHTTTLIFAGTRKLAERISARLQAKLGEEAVTCHHSSLSKERRLDAETRLKAGSLRALVATASLELGIDIGDIDLVVQVGVPKSIATFLQRVGRAGHTLSAIPKGRILPLTIDELVEGAAILRAVGRGTLDRTPQPAAPLDILAQQVVAACAAKSWSEDELFTWSTRAWPYRSLDRPHFDAILELHAHGRNSLLHRDGVNGRVRGTRRARLTAITSGGAIPDRADYRVVLAPEGTFIGSIDEDFAVEASVGDIFQLGSTSWQVLKVEPGVMHVGDAHGVPPTLPFWFGEAPARTVELSHEVGEVREHGEDLEWLKRECGIPEEAAEQIVEYVTEGRTALGAIPTPHRIIVERFFDESGGQQMVVHAVFGGRINRAWALGLRKKFCRNFGFELQAAANEDSFVLSLGLQHSFTLDEIFGYIRAAGLEKALKQAILPLPMFSTRWRWNVQRSLQLPRMLGGKRVPPPIQRMKADDLLAQSFPEVLACGETLPPGDFEVPNALEQPIVAQTIEDCLREAMDVDGAMAVLGKIESGEIETITVDLPAPSSFARAILNAAPYAFLDDAPLEERRTQAVLSRRGLDKKSADDIGALDPAAVVRVREEAWPDPQDLEEMHEVLLWIGYVTEAEADRGGVRRGVLSKDDVEKDESEARVSWRPWLEELVAAGRVEHVVEHGNAGIGRYLAVESTRDPKELMRGRIDALGPIDPTEEELFHLRQLEGEGAVMRVRLDEKDQWCERRLLARIQRYTLETLREQIRPVSPSDFVAFLAEWQHVAPGSQLTGPQGLLEVIAQLAGFEVPAPEWERSIFRARIADYRREWLDELTMTGQVVWGRLWGSANSAPRSTPITLLPREDVATWLALAPEIEAAVSRDETVVAGAATADSKEATEGTDDTKVIPWHARQIFDYLSKRGASFADQIQSDLTLLPSHLDEGLASLVAHGLLTNDSFAALRKLVVPSRKRGTRIFRKVATGRWDRFRVPPPVEGADPTRDPKLDRDLVDHYAHQLLLRYGVVFKRLLEKERLPVPWRDLLRVYRRMELRGEVRGGRFVGGPLAGEQYALPRAVPLLRKMREEVLELGLEGLAARDPVQVIREALIDRVAEGRGTSGLPGVGSKPEI